MGKVIQIPFVDSAGNFIKSVTGPDVDNTDPLNPVINRPPTELNGRIVVNQDNVSTTLGGTIDSTKEYFIDGVINCTGVSIEVPPTGLYLKGYNFDTSKLFCSDDSYVMFTSPPGGSGNFLGTDYAIEVTGVGSKAYELVAQTGFEAFEFDFINYNNCTSLGSIEGYRQGLESGTGRFGGTPSLELIGTWLGGYRITTSIVRSLADGSYSLFKAGLGFVMNSRFKTDINCDLPASASFLDFSPSNFNGSSLLQVNGAIFTRNGVTDAMDANIFPNITNANLESLFRNSVGVKNTYAGGRIECTAETVTTITTAGVFETVLGTFAASDLQHFDNPSGSQLRNLGNNPVEYKAQGEFVVKGNSNNVLELRLTKFNGSTNETVGSIVRSVNSLQGGRDVAFFNFLFNFELTENQYVFWEIANNSNTANVTLETGSIYQISER